MGRYLNRQIENALANRPAPKGVLIPVPRHEKYLFCPETDWLYSTKMSQCEMYPLQRIEPQHWNDMFEGFNVSRDGESHKLSIEKLRNLKPKDYKMWNEPKQLNNAANPTGIDFKNKFLIGSIDKETGAVSFSALPARQPTREAAKKEAVRLAGLHKTKHFMVVNVLDIASVQDVVFL